MAIPLPNEKTTNTGGLVQIGTDAQGNPIYGAQPAGGPGGLGAYFNALNTASNTGNMQALGTTYQESPTGSFVDASSGQAYAPYTPPPSAPPDSRIYSGGASQAQVPAAPAAASATRNATASPFVNPTDRSGDNAVIFAAPRVPVQNPSKAMGAGAQPSTGYDLSPNPPSMGYDISPNPPSMNMAPSRQPTVQNPSKPTIPATPSGGGGTGGTGISGGGGTPYIPPATGGTGTAPAPAPGNTGTFTPPPAMTWPNFNLQLPPVNFQPFTPSTGAPEWFGQPAPPVTVNIPEGFMNTGVTHNAPNSLQGVFDKMSEWDPFGKKAQAAGGGGDGGGTTEPTSIHNFDLKAPGDTWRMDSNAGYMEYYDQTSGNWVPLDVEGSKINFGDDLRMDFVSGYMETRDPSTGEWSKADDPSNLPATVKYDENSGKYQYYEPSSGNWITINADATYIYFGSGIRFNHNTGQFEAQDAEGNWQTQSTGYEGQTVQGGQTWTPDQQAMADAWRSNEPPAENPEPWRDPDYQAPTNQAPTTQTQPGWTPDQQALADAWRGGYVPAEDPEAWRY